MGKVRSCDARCHKARNDACSCWCGGLFHGTAGNVAREAFREEFGGEHPATEEEFGQQSLLGDMGKWHQAVAKAREAERGK